MKWFVPWLFAAVTLVGCAPPASRGNFESEDPASLLYAIGRAGRRQDRSAIGHLVQALEHDDPAVRMMAINALERLNGERLGYNPYSSQRLRHEMVKVWVEAVNQGRFETDER